MLLCFIKVFEASLMVQSVAAWWPGVTLYVKLGIHVWPLQWSGGQVDSKEALVEVEDDVDTEFNLQDEDKLRLLSVKKHFFWMSS